MPGCNKMYFLLFFLIHLSLEGKSQHTALYPPGIEHVIVVGVDAMSPDGIRTAQTPVMHEMIKTGAVKWNVRTILPSSSSPNWASMIMGAGTEAHGILDNDWGRQDYTLPPLVSDEEDIFPTIFGWIHRNRPHAEIGAVYQWEGFGRLFEKSAVSYDINRPDELSATIDFDDYVKSKKPLFAFLHLDHVDEVGHNDGHGTPEYYRAVSRADSLIGLVRKSIKEAGMEGNTLLIVTADHGGTGYGHGGATIEEAEIAMILSGRGIKKGYQIQQQVYTYDLAATIAFALHIVPPYVWTGRPIKPAFIGWGEPENLYMGKSLIPSPKVYPWKYLYKKAGGLYVNQPALVTMETVAPKAVTRYTTDGSIPTSSSSLYEKPFTLDSTTVVTARSFDISGNASQPVAAYFRIVATNQGHGVHAHFYPGADWNHLPVFSYVKSTREWDSYEIGLDREQIMPLLGKDSSTFGVTFGGYLQIDQGGKYSFYTQSDDGSKLYIDGQEVVNNDGDHGVIERKGDIELSGGRHRIRVEYYNGGGGFWLDAMYKGPGVPKQLIPASKLFLREN